MSEGKCQEEMERERRKCRLADRYKQAEWEDVWRANDLVEPTFEHRVGGRVDDNFSGITGNDSSRNLSNCWNKFGYV